MELGALTAMTFGFRERELVLDIFEMITGLRMNSAYIRPGGVAQDIPDGGVDKIAETLPLLRKRLKDTANLLIDNNIWMGRTVGIGFLDLTGCMALGVTGPILRATGLPHDLRKSQPYCGYETYEFDVVTETTCDAYGRFLIRVREMLTPRPCSAARGCSPSPPRQERTSAGHEKAAWNPASRASRWAV
jgi:NADH-quinone oxidoreductase subunit D